MSHFRKLPLAVLICSLPLLTVVGCGEKQEQIGGAHSGCPDSGAKVFFTAQGVVILNGRQLEPSQLKDALSGLSPTPTVICYSRENGEGEPHPAMQSVLEAMMATRLPIGFFTDATFRTPVKPQ